MFPRRAPQPPPIPTSGCTEPDGRTNKQRRADTVNGINAKNKTLLPAHVPGGLMRPVRTSRIFINSPFILLPAVLLNPSTSPSLLSAFYLFASQLLGRWREPCRTLRIWWSSWLTQELQGIELFVMLSTQSPNSSSHLKVSIHESFFFFSQTHANLIPLDELL